MNDPAPAAPGPTTSAAAFAAETGEDPAADGAGGPIDAAEGMEVGWAEGPAADTPGGYATAGYATGDSAPGGYTIESRGDLAAAAADRGPAGGFDVTVSDGLISDGWSAIGDEPLAAEGRAMGERAGETAVGFSPAGDGPPTAAASDDSSPATAAGFAADASSDLEPAAAAACEPLRAGPSVYSVASEPVASNPGAQEPVAHGPLTRELVAQPSDRRDPEQLDRSEPGPLEPKEPGEPDCREAGDEGLRGIRGEAGDGRRRDGRQAAMARPVRFLWDPMGFALSSVTIETGRTRVLCSVCLEEEVPRWRRGSGSGWLSAEYRLLPASTPSRQPRELLKLSGRTQEIQRLIGRSLRACLDLQLLGERSLLVDCDVLQADAGTRTAAISGAWVALAAALERLQQRGLLGASPLRQQVAAVSVGLVEGRALLDLDYSEDSRAEVDLNVVMDDQQRLLEIQGTAEGAPFSRQQLNTLLDLAAGGISTLQQAQRTALRQAQDSTPAAAPLL